MHLKLLGRHASMIVALLILIVILSEFSSQTIADDPKGPFEPTWESLKKNYRTPQWFQDGKFGIFIHWGLYSLPAFRVPASPQRTRIKPPGS